VHQPLEQWRGIATRYDKTAIIYLAGLHIAGILLRSARQRGPGW
jgi:hypothetical protein